MAQNDAARHATRGRPLHNQNAALGDDPWRCVAQGIRLTVNAAVLAYT